MWIGAVLLAGALPAPVTGQRAEDAEERLERAYELLSDGRVTEGRSELLTAASTLPPSDATPVLRLSRLLGQLSEDGAERAARAAGDAHRGRTRRAVDRLVRDLGGLPASERAALLLLGARLSVADGQVERAAELWYRIADQHRGSAEWAEAVVRLSEHRIGTGVGLDEARELLEALIVQDPSAALAPTARQVLERIASRSAGEGRP